MVLVPRKINNRMTVHFEARHVVTHALFREWKFVFNESIYLGEMGSGFIRALSYVGFNRRH
jgi:hypothetical protein